MLDNSSEQKKFEGIELDELDPWEIVGIILKHRWEILLIIALCLLGGFFWNLYATPIYRAKSSVVIKTHQPGSIIKERQSDLPNYVNTLIDFNTKIEMINTDPLGEELVQLLIEKGHFKNKREAIDYDNLDSEQQMNVRRGWAKGIVGGVNVNNPKMTNLVEIYFNSPNRVLARDVVNLLAEIVVKQHQQEQIQIYRNITSILSKQLDEARNRYHESQERLFKYRLEHGITDSVMDRKLLNESRGDLVKLLAKLSDSKSEHLSKINEIDKILSKRDFTKYTPVVDNPTLLELNNNLVFAQVELDELLVNYGQNHPDVIKVGEKIEFLKKKFEEELIKIRTKLGFEVNVLNERMEQTQEMLEQMESMAVSDSQKDINYAIIKSDTDVASEHYNNMLSALKEVSVSSSNERNSYVYVHERAVTPTRPIKPKKSTNLMIALFLGMMLGGGYAVGREFLDQSIRSPEDVKKLTQLPVLSTMPLFTGNSDDMADRPLMVATRPKSLFSESVTALRTQLNIKLPQEKPLAIAITSSSPREGKSLISSNLAISMAIDGKKTLLLDADLHRPSVHRIFKMERTAGVFDIVVEALSPRWQEMNTDGMSFGDIQHMIRLKQWSGTMKVQWDSLPEPLSISYTDGQALGSNIDQWKTKYSTPTGEFPHPATPKFDLDENELSELDKPRQSGKQAVDFIKQYPRLVKSSYFAEQILSNYIIESEYKNLHILTAGTNPKNPNEILGSEQMKILLQILSERYDRIIIDCPPAWPLSDVSVLSPMTDGVLWITRTGEIPKNMFQKSVQQIQAVQPHIIGVVLNALDVQGSKYYGYSYYYKYYRNNYYHYYSDYISESDRK